MNSISSQDRRQRPFDGQPYLALTQGDGTQFPREIELVGKFVQIRSWVSSDREDENEWCGWR